MNLSRLYFQNGKNQSSDQNKIIHRSLTHHKTKTNKIPK